VAALAASERWLFAARFEKATAALELAPAAEGEALPAAVRVALAAQRAEVELVAGTVRRRFDSYAATLEALRELGPEAEALPEQAVRARFLAALAAAELHAGELDGAAEHAAAAAELRGLLDDAAGRAEAVALALHVAHLKLLRESGERARRTELLGRYEAAIRDAEAVGARRALAVDLHHLGRLLAETFADPVGAIPLYRRAAALREELGDRPGLAPVYHALGDLHAELGETATAAHWFRVAFVSADEIGYVRFRVNPRLRLAELLRARGEADAARGWLAEARRIAAADGWQAGEEEAARRLAALD